MKARPDPATRYAREVAAGDTIAGPHVRNACRRHLGDLEHGPGRGLTWDAKAAGKAIDFFPLLLRLNGGQYEGKPFELHPSQQFIIGNLFGWKRGPRRRYRRAYIEVGKGNGKSPLAAGIGIYCLMADGEMRAEVYAAASKKDQAFVLFRDAVAMYQQSPDIKSRLVTSGANPVWNLAHLDSHSFFRPISSDDGQSGPRPHCALCDEVHEMRGGTNMIEMLERGFKWRRSPLLVMTTNAGSDRNSICWQEHQHAVRVAAGTRSPDDAYTFVGEPIDDESFSYVTALDAEDDPLTDPACWVKANPLLDITITSDYLAGVVRQAISLPGRENTIRRLHFCQWTESEVGWISRPALEAVLSDFDPAEHEGAELYIGVDLSATKDLTALAMIVPTGMVEVERDDGTTLAPTFDLWCEPFTPLDTLAERAARDDLPYEQWVAEGWMTATPGPLVRYDYLARRIAELSGAYVVVGIAYDAMAFKRRFTEELDSAGITAPLFEHPQGGKRKAADSGLWMPGSVRALEELILEKRIRIRRDDCTVSAFMSAALERDAFDNAWFSKRQAYRRIDPLVASGMAAGLAVDRAAVTFDVRARIA